MQLGTGGGDWRTNLCSATSLLVETDVTQDGLTGVIDVLQINATEVIVRNRYSTFEETYHIYSTGKVVIDAKGATGAFVFDGDFAVNNSASHAGGYHGFVEITETNAASATDYANAGTVTMTTGTLETNRQFDYNTNGFEESQGSYNVIASSNALNFALNGATTNRYKPAFLIEEFYPKTGDAATARTSFHSRLDASADLTSPQVGNAGAFNGVLNTDYGFVSGLRGNGFKPLTATGRFTIPDTNITAANGDKFTIEFTLIPNIDAALFLGNKYLLNYRSVATSTVVGAWSFYYMNDNSWSFTYTVNDGGINQIDAVGSYDDLTFNANEKIHLRLVVDAPNGVAKIYQNGVLYAESSESIKGFGAKNSTNIYVSCTNSGGSNATNWIFDDFYIYNDVVYPYGAYFTDSTNSYRQPDPDIMFYDNCENANAHTAQIGGAVTVNGTLALANGVDDTAGGALDFDTAGDYIQMPSTLFNFKKGSVSFWCKVASGGSAFFKAYVDANTDITVGATGTDYFYISVSGNGTSNNAKANDNGDGVPDLENNKWYHIKATWDLGTGGTGMKIYVNGELKATTSNSNLPTGTISYVRLGALANSTVIIDEFYLTSSPITSQIHTVAGLPVRIPNLMQNGVNRVFTEGTNISATNCASSYIIQNLSNVTDNSTFVVGDADAIGPTIANATIYDTDNDGNINEILIRYGENLKDSSLSANSDANRFTWNAIACTGIDSVTVAGSGNTTNATDPDRTNDRYITIFTDDSSVVGTGVKTLAFTTNANKYEDSLGNDSPTNASATIVDAAAPVLLNVYTADVGGTAGIFNEAGDRMDLVFSETISALPTLA
ncbi:MAG: hypothetical protein ACD_79C01274G0001, partial [uncultured bacterium]